LQNGLQELKENLERIVRVEVGVFFS
jgi:hypothetical protein